MSFLSEIKKKREKLKETETVVTNVNGVKYVEGTSKILDQSGYGFVVDTKPDDIPVFITSYVYIGSQDCAVNTVLKEYGIQCVLSLGIEVQVGNIDKKFVYLLDLPETNLKATLKDCLLFINDAVKKCRNVLIHCNAGVSRSSAVIIAYLMHYERMQFSDAYQLVKSKRPVIQPNTGFKKQLQCMMPGNIF